MDKITPQENKSQEDLTASPQEAPFNMPLSAVVVGPRHSQLRDGKNDLLAVLWTDSDHKEARYVATAVNSHAALLNAVTKAQATLAQWIVPNSLMGDSQCLAELLEILDNKDLVELMRGAK